MQFITSFIVFGVLIFTVSCDKSDIGLNPVELIEKHGYICETHYITTEDGYILGFHRVPHGINDNGTAKRPAVLVMHGLTSGSADFVNMGTSRSLGFILADSGYDVWLGNARGTTFSRNHTILDPDIDREKFYGFSWHEIGYYDVANAIDYILSVTGNDSLYYIGHSQGTTTFLVLASTRPEYNKKVKLASLMAPAAIVGHTPSTFRQTLCKYIDKVEKVLKNWKIYEYPYTKEIREYVSTRCADPTTVPFCDFLYKSLWSGDGGQILEESLPVIFTNNPSNSGMKLYLHYGQLVRDGTFHQYDFGKEKNLEIYGSETPPDYDLSKISTPVAFYYAKNDGLITVEDAQTLISMVPNVANDYLVPYDLFVHIDFIFAKDIVKLVYDELMSVMKQY